MRFWANYLTSVSVSSSSPAMYVHLEKTGKLWENENIFVRDQVMGDSDIFFSTTSYSQCKGGNEKQI